MVLGPSCTKPHGDRRRTGQWRRRSARCTTPLRDRSDLLRGSGRHLCPRLPGRRRQSRAEAPSLVVASVAEHDGLDDATAQFLLQQVLRARAEDEMVAKEQAELDQMVGDLAVKEDQLLAELQRVPHWRLGLHSSVWKGPPLFGSWPRRRSRSGRRRKKKEKEEEAGRCWVLLKEYCGFLGVDFWFILVFSFAWYDSGCMYGLVGVFLRPLVPGSYLIEAVLA